MNGRETVTARSSQVVALMLDDSPTYLEVVQRLLTARGYEVVVTSCWWELPTLLRRVGPDVVILDLNLSDPHVDGVVIGSTLRRFSDVPILFLSSEPEATLQGAVESVPRSSFLPKSTDLAAHLPARLLAMAAGGRQGSGLRG